MLLQSSTYQSHIHKPYTYMFYDNKTRRLQTFVLMSWIRIDFYGSRLRSWSFLCVTFHTSLFVHALWVFTSKISQTSLGIHLNQKYLFVINEDGVKFSLEIQIFRKIMEFMLTLAVIPPLSFLLEDEHRSSMGEESLHHLWQMLCKYYVAKSSEEQKKKLKKNMMRRKEK
jgi:hypothetical protein